MFTPRLVVSALKPFWCIAFIIIACCTASGAIREFPIRTIEKLGRELHQETQRPQSLSEAQQRAKRAAMNALPGLQKRGYRFAVLADPERKGYLVYALATSRNPREIVLGLHYRVSVSPEGKVQRVDPLAWSDNVIKGGRGDLPARFTPVGFYTSSMVSNQPVETLVYATLRHRRPCVVITHDESTWLIENGRITKDPKKN